MPHLVMCLWLGLIDGFGKVVQEYWDNVVWPFVFRRTQFRRGPLSLMVHSRDQPQEVPSRQQVGGTSFYTDTLND